MTRSGQELTWIKKGGRLRVIPSQPSWLRQHIKCCRLLGHRALEVHAPCASHRSQGNPTLRSPLGLSHLSAFMVSKGRRFQLHDLLSLSKSVLVVTAVAFTAMTVSAPQNSYADFRWKGEIPAEAKEPKPWTDLLQLLMDHQEYYGVIATSARMVVLFQDLPSKERAYRAVIELMDKGYPYSTQSVFLSGDIQPQNSGDTDYEFANSYNLYKAVLNKDKGMHAWAENYFSQIDKQNFPKFLFYNALEAYSKGDLNKATDLLQQILSKELPADHLPFVRKVARTLARIYFDQEQYDKSINIYQTFLLKLNPIVTSDWIEAAWNLYHLKRYSEAIGALYNLEAKNIDPSLNLEKYTIRALSYRSLCSVPNAEELIKTFEQDFGPIIRGIKRGSPLTAFPILRQIRIPENMIFQQISFTLQELYREWSETMKSSWLPRELRSTANYLYSSEIRMLRQKIKAYDDKALERAAEQLVMMSEQLRFLKFDVARERFNPDSVLIQDEKKPPQKSLIDNESTESFRIHWVQLGDFWRDERLSYKGDVKNRCGE